MIIVIVLETYLIKEARALVLVLQKHMVVLSIIQGETSIPNGVTDKDVSPFTNKLRPVAKEIVK
jgi:hypothetical protein